MKKIRLNKTMGSLRRDILEFAASSYQTEPDYPWNSLPEYAVLRHLDTRKWRISISPAPF